MNMAAISQPATTAATALVPGTFLDPVAIGIVLGGTALAMVLRNRLADVGRALAALTELWRRPFSADVLLGQIAAQERIAHRHGLFSLDRAVIADPDMAAAIEAAVDGASPEQVERLVCDRVTARAERHRAAIEVWTGAAEAAPAMGLIGTILGLVQMFASMQDPVTIGAAMAVALLATLYGALVANLIAMPVASRLKRLARAEATERLRLAAPLAHLATLERARKREIAA
jgi:chemotaxis protein MotA